MTGPRTCAIMEVSKNHPVFRIRRTAMETKFCENCGAKMPVESKFCTECGTPFPKREEKKETPAPAEQPIEQ
ncbi:MAG: zinc-ribbon domain-containing protein, partial [Clostridia bacterium]|nr:zinc-ribbon domain-containing protein [Clostridia bacterium]